MEGFEDSKHTLLAGNLGLPLMWLTMFSSDSLAIERFRVKNDVWTPVEDDEIVLESEDVVLESPISDVDLCLERISVNTPKLESALGLKAGVLNDYARNLRLAVKAGSGFNVTADYEELEWMTGAYKEAARRLLTYFDGGPVAGVQIHCLTLAESLHLDRPLLPATGFFDTDWEDEDLQNLESLLGSGWRATPLGKCNAIVSHVQRPWR